MDAGPGGPLRMRLCVMGFVSHSTWAEGYARASAHRVAVATVGGDRWKWRMQCGAVEFAAGIVAAGDEQLVIVDGMFDLSALAATLRRGSAPGPKLVLYMHENQLTTPFTGKDRDKQNNTHWHYGAAHWRSMLAADLVVFNSETHRAAFAKALPKLINAQCPRDTVGWHTSEADRLVAERCVTLHNGLDLADLAAPAAAARASRAEMASSDLSNSSARSGGGGAAPPVVLWNARLEEDKNPEAFVAALRALRGKGVPFGLVVLGVDPTKDKRWHAIFETEFAAQLLFCGFCDSRDEYARWLGTSDVVLSTANHETFGVAMVECGYCGVLPLFPRRLSYPELLDPAVFPAHFYTHPYDCATKLAALLALGQQERSAAAARVEARMREFEWSAMAPVYDAFWSRVAAGEI